MSHAVTILLVALMVLSMVAPTTAVAAPGSAAAPASAASDPGTTETGTARDGVVGSTAATPVTAARPVSPAPDSSVRAGGGPAGEHLVSGDEAAVHADPGEQSPNNDSGTGNATAGAVDPYAGDPIGIAEGIGLGLSAIGVAIGLVPSKDHDAPAVETVEITGIPENTVDDFNVGDKISYTVETELYPGDCTEQGQTATVTIRMFVDGRLVATKTTSGLTGVKKHTVEASGEVVALDNQDQLTLEAKTTVDSWECSWWFGDDRAQARGSDEHTVNVATPFDARLRSPTDDPVNHLGSQGGKVQAVLEVRSHTIATGGFSGGTLRGITSESGETIHNTKIMIMNQREITPANAWTESTGWQEIGRVFYGDPKEHICEESRRITIFAPGGLDHDLNLGIPAGKFGKWSDQGTWYSYLNDRYRVSSIVRQDICDERGVVGVDNPEYPVDARSPAIDDPPGDPLAPRNVSASGYVVDVDGEPLANVTLTVRGNDTVVTTTTNRSGFYSFEANLSYTVTVRYGGGPYSTSHNHTLVARPSLARGHNFTMRSTLTPVVTGRTVNQAGDPVRTEIWLETEAGNASLGLTDPDGSFAITPLRKRGLLPDPDEMTLVFTPVEGPTRLFDSARETVRVDISNGSDLSLSPVVLRERLSPTAERVTVRGRVTRFDPATGRVEPVTRIRIAAFNASTGDRVARDTPNDTGRWALDVPAGQRIEVRTNATDFGVSPDRANTTVTLVDDTSAGVMQLPSLDVAPAATLVPANGSVGIDVGLRDPDGGILGRPENATVTTTAGAFARNGSARVGVRMAPTARVTLRTARPGTASVTARLDGTPAVVGTIDIRVAGDPDGDGVHEDANGDGRITPADATVLSRAVAADVGAVDGPAFDIDGDGSLASADATALFDRALGSGGAPPPVGATPVGLSLAPADRTVATGASATYRVTVDGARGGIGGYDLVVSTDSPSTARITNASTRNGGEGRAEIAADGSSVRLGSFAGDTADSGSNVTIAQVTVTGEAAGNATLSIEPASVSDEDGTRYAVSATSNATLAVERQPPDVTGDGNPATDPDGDGRFEDVNGDGMTTPGDATVLFDAVFGGNAAVTGNVALFDFNGDGSVTSGDATVLFDEVFAA